MRIQSRQVVIVLLTFFAILFLLLPSCRHQQEVSGEKALRNWYLQEQDSLLATLHVLDSMVHHQMEMAPMQQQFALSRFRYKRIEAIVEYYFQGLTRRINGPAIADVKTEDNQVWPPHGFQVVEQYLYSPFADSLRPALSNEIKLLQTDLHFVAANLEQTAILPRHVREMIQHQLIRIGTLGITGMDAPLSKLSLEEAAHALDGLVEMIGQYTHAEKKSNPLPDAAANQIRQASNYLRMHGDFDSFDRMVFLRDHLSPLSTALRQVPVSTTAEDSLFAKPFSGTLSDLLQGRGFNPDYYTTYEAAKTNAAKVALGKKLFYDAGISKSGTVSCATCHQPEKFFTDGRIKAANKVHGGSLLRNTPSLYYAALQRDQFFDQRAATLEDQVHEVMVSSDEFNQEATQVVQQLSGSNEYRSLFAKAFGKESFSSYEVRNAIAAYVRTLSPFASRFDQYMRGKNNAMSTQELQGFNLFAGKAKCATCHFIPLFNGTVPPWFTKSESEIIGVPATPVWVRAKVDADPGRYKLNQLEALRFAFKTPTVRNSAPTAPYMHNGVYKTLDEVVQFYQKGGGVGLGMNLPFQTLPFDSLVLHKKEQQAIVAFLHTLTDVVRP